MAKAAKGRSKTQSRTARQGSATKRSPGRPSSRKSRKESGSLDLLGMATTLVSSAVGRAIVAEVLAATAEVLRRHRSDVGEADEQRLNSATPRGLATEPTSEVLARSAAGALAEVASDAIHRMRLEPSGRDDDEGARRSR